MIRHLNHIILSIELALLASQSAAEQWVRNGDGHLVGYGTTIYEAVEYRPTCGTLTLAASNWPSPYMAMDTCYSSMVSYQTIGETFGLYDLKGVPQSGSTPIGQGLALCMCFSLKQAGYTGKEADLCMEVGPNGEQPMYGSHNVGVYQIGNKSLPQCSALTNASSTSGNTRASQPSATGLPVTTKHTPGGPIAVGIWLPIVIIAILGAVGIYYKRPQYLAKKEGINLKSHAWVGGA